MSETRERETRAASTKAAPPARWVKVWDLPTRLFHWSLLVLVAAAYVTATLGWIDWHFRAGYAILALLLFRLAWGIVGSETARFGAFVRGPRAAIAHLAHLFRRQPDTEAGHNAAGGLMVVALIALLLIQATSGLFATDGLFSEGPLAHLIASDLAERITGWHVVNFYLILTLVTLHVAAVLLYAGVRRQDLVRPMVTGWKRLPAAVAAPRLASPAAAGALLAAAAGAVWAVANLT